MHDIFEKLRLAGLKINKEKSYFCRPELKYLGHVITPVGVMVDPEKVSSVVDYPVPTNLKQLRSFLGLVSWYRKYVPNFSDVAQPLTALLKKNCRWVWSDKCQLSFEELKAKLITSPILTCPDYSRPLILQTDASFSGLGAVLAQEYDGKEKVIAYASRTLTHQGKKILCN